MVPVICDVCGTHFTETLVPNYLWKMADTDEMMHFCPDCIIATSLFIRARALKLKPETVTIELPPHRLPKVEEPEEEQDGNK